MEITRNSIITLANGHKYLILGRTSYMDKDYYPAWEVDSDNNPIKWRIVMLYQDNLPDDFFVYEEEPRKEETGLYLETLHDTHLKGLIWEIFCEQEKEDWF